MLITHCENSECTEAFTAKEVPPDLATATVACGGCGRECVSATESDATPGEDVRK
jgi:hypothetical protein